MSLEGVKQGVIHDLPWGGEGQEQFCRLVKATAGTVVHCWNLKWTPKYFFESVTYSANVLTATARKIIFKKVKKLPKQKKKRNIKCLDLHVHEEPTTALYWCTGSLKQIQEALTPALPPRLRSYCVTNSSCHSLALGISTNKCQEQDWPTSISYQRAMDVVPQVSLWCDFSSKIVNYVKSCARDSYCRGFYTWKGWRYQSLESEFRHLFPGWQTPTTF